MRNVAFVIGSIALAIVVIVGYQQIRPTGQRVASSGAAPQTGDSSELANRLLLPPYLSQDGATYELRLYPGALPPDPKIDLPQPSGARLVGSALRLKNNNPASLDAVMDVPVAAGDVAAFFERELGKLGWSPSPNKGMQPGGFVSMPAVTSRTFCKGETPPWLSVSVFSPPGAALDVRTHVDLISPSPGPATYGPCSQQVPPQARPMGFDKLPALRPPTGVILRSGGSGGGGDRQSSQATATTKISAADLEANFSQQLVAAGWTRLAHGADGPVAWSTWKLPGDGDWRGTLFVNELTTEMRSLSLEAQLVQ